MATTPVLFTIDEYLHTSYKPDADFVNGVIEERHMGEYQHARLQAFIATLFSNSEDAWGIETAIEQRIRVSPTSVRICDVAILHAEAPYEPVTLTPPFICIEILSPEDRFARAKEVLADYLSMGVPHVWLIDPIRRAAYTFDTGGLREVTPALLLVPGTQISLDVAALFQRLDKKPK